MKLLLDDLELPVSNLTGKIRETTILLHTHPLYKSIRTIEDVRIYMTYQVWCVWDFMALLKSLQRGLMTDKIGWVPPKHSDLCAFIYEILLTEETDITSSGLGHASHFESYLDAMVKAGADTTSIIGFITMLKQTGDVELSLECNPPPQSALSFVHNTLKHAHSPLHKAVSVFCLSREGLIPGMFTSFIPNVPNQHELSAFIWYLKRHKEIDEDSHGPNSVKLFRAIVGHEKTQLDEALSAALDALLARKTFLDSIHNHISTKS